MINKDKFGNTIYEKVYQRLLIKGQILKLNGYVESSNKPNLFFKKMPEGVLFADMRGTAEVSIWEDLSPLFYWNFNEQTPMWKRRRIIAREFEQLSMDGCDCRLSDNDIWDTTEECATSMASGHGYGHIIWIDGGDGYCLHCGKDIQSDEIFCSVRCRDLHDETTPVKCVVCDVPGREVELIPHHVCYDPEITIQVCRSCHMKIHHTTQYLHLRPFVVRG
jgi:hypothetical protein